MVLLTPTLLFFISACIQLASIVPYCCILSNPLRIMYIMRYEKGRGKPTREPLDFCLLLIIIRYERSYCTIQTLRTFDDFV